MLIPVLVVAALPSLLTHWHSISAWWKDGQRGGPDGQFLSSHGNPPVFDTSTRPGFILAATLFVVALVYFTVFLRGRGASPGKLMTGLQVRLRDQPGRLAWRTVLVRVAAMGPLVGSVVLPGIGRWLMAVAALDCLWAVWDPRNQTLHDKAARTNVVRLKH